MVPSAATPSPEATAARVPPPVRSRPTAASPLALALLEGLERAGVRYCHWKGDPPGIQSALSEETDLDLLIDAAHSDAAAAALARCGLKPCTAVRLMRNPAVEDYLTLDADTSRLLHCHVHYRLIVGEPFLKAYRLPWEERMLASRRRDSSCAIYVPDPTLELLLVCLRAATRLRWRDIAAAPIGRPCVTVNTAAEYAWLRERVNPAAAADLCSELLGPPVTPAFLRLISGEMTCGNVLAFRRAAGAVLQTWRLYRPVAGRLLAWRRELSAAVARLNRPRLSIARPLRRVPSSGGVMIAFLGADGAGKSTIARALASVLASKLDVYSVYFGSGDGPSSLLRWPLRLARRVAGHLRLLRPAASPSPASPALPSRRRSGLGRSFARGLWAMTLALEKRRKLRRAWQARARGMIVLADRYPQVQVAGFTDGPLLHHLAARRPATLRALARLEAVPYRWAARHPPDVVVKLVVTRDTAIRRKPETGTEQVERRIAAIQSLAFPGATVVEIDADQPLGDVLRDVERVVWSHV